jgi:hypothetical protein
LTIIYDPRGRVYDPLLARINEIMEEANWINPLGIYFSKVLRIGLISDIWINTSLVVEAIILELNTKISQL